MIANEKQYQITKNWHKKFTETLEELQANPPSDSDAFDLYSNSLKGQIKEFEHDIKEYEEKIINGPGN